MLLTSDESFNKSHENLETLNIVNIVSGGDQVPGPVSTVSTLPRDTETVISVPDDGQ